MSKVNLRENIGNVLAYIVSSSENFGRIKLVKSVYFTDLVYYNLSGEFAIGDTYFVQQCGPMGYLAGELTKNTNEFIQIRPQTVQYENNGYVSLTPANLEGYSQSIQIAIEANKHWVESQSAKHVSKITHELEMWRSKSRMSIISENEFRLNRSDRGILAKSGILITDFGRNICSVTRNLPTCIKSLDSADLDDVFTHLIREFPVDLWAEYDDCFLACVDALREISETKGTETLLKRVCDLGGAMSIALAYTPTQNSWVAGILKEYAETFDSVASDICGVSDKLDKDGHGENGEVRELLRTRAATLL